MGLQRVGQSKLTTEDAGEATRRQCWTQYEGVQVALTQKDDKRQKLRCDIADNAHMEGRGELAKQFKCYLYA